jgi:biopolymer transport protein ExbD
MPFPETDRHGLSDCRPLADINVTPLVDVMLVLLIIFMVTAPMLVAGLGIHLPKASQADPVTRKPPVVVTVTKDGKYLVGSEAVAREGLAAAVRDRLGEDQPAYIQGDHEASYGSVIAIVDLLSGAGIAKVVMIVERGRAGGDGRPDHAPAGDARP